MKTETLPKIYAVIWSSDWAGNVPGPQTVRAYLSAEEAAKDPDAGKRTYDGVYACTQGSYDIAELKPSKRLLTLSGHGAIFGLTADNKAGAWFGEIPVPSARKTCKPGYDVWSWSREESIYIQALWAAKNPPGWAKLYAL